jgi:predicted LPLAT superfamily acyltransferase
VAPEWLYRPCRALGTLIAMANMPAQRRHSRAYLALVLGRAPTRRELWRHFFAFEEMLMLKLRVVNGLKVRCRYGPDSLDCSEAFASGRPLLLGTFHVGVSDLLGFLLGDYLKLPVYLVRQRVGNSYDTDKLAERIGERLRFVWVNDPGEMLYALKAAAAAPAVIALQCDRVEFSARTETFDFLGARRVFPFTIYHLALIFGRPVILSFGVAEGQQGAVVHASPLFEPRPGEGREAGMVRARAHFQAFLHQLEAQLRADPYLWFNFTPLNPPAGARPTPPA